MSLYVPLAIVSLDEEFTSGVSAAAVLSDISEFRLVSVTHCMDALGEMFGRYPPEVVVCDGGAIGYVRRVLDELEIDAVIFLVMPAEGSEGMKEGHMYPASICDYLCRCENVSSVSALIPVICGASSILDARRKALLPSLN